MAQSRQSPSLWNSITKSIERRRVAVGLFIRRRLVPFLSTATAMLGNCAGDGESREKQIAMIAQKIVYAKQAQEPGRRPVTTSDPRTMALWTTLPDHLTLFSSPSLGRSVRRGL